MARNPGFEAVKQTANPKPPATMFHGRLPRSKWRVLFLPNITFPICGQKAEFGFHLALQHPSSTLFFIFFFYHRGSLVQKVREASIFVILFSLLFLVILKAWVSLRPPGRECQSYLAISGEVSRAHDVSHSKGGLQIL